ncbi:MAG: OmpA family protein [Candidatus Neomarinimicrobiota bacterium]
MTTTRTSGIPGLYWFLLVLFALGAVGCVSKSKYDDKAAQVEKLRQKAADLNQQNQQLEARVQVLEGQLLTVVGEKGFLEVRIDSLVKQTAADLERLHAFQQQLEQSLRAEIDRGEITIAELRGRLSINIVDQILFLSGETEVRQKGQEVLNRVGDVLKNVKRQRIQIAGHTDNVPVGEKLQHLYATNWELSTARATTVTRLLIEKYGVNPKLVAAAGYAEYKPVASNETKAGRAKNRRIEIILTPVETGRTAVFIR